MVFDSLPHTQCVVNQKNLNLGQNYTIMVVAVELTCMPKRPFSKKFKVLFLV
jgi:hypothetical protein